jgi:hypothetical protein
MRMGKGIGSVTDEELESLEAAVSFRSLMSIRILLFPPPAVAERAVERFSWVFGLSFALPAQTDFWEMSRTFRCSVSSHGKGRRPHNLSVDDRDGFCIEKPATYGTPSHTAYARYPSHLMQYEIICETGSVIGCCKKNW